ncbi:MAG: DUF3795 domain-containing protein [Bacteroidales bacterium]|nr:DUF3795 domain-containing protein [Bacteroidales bacterium]
MADMIAYCGLRCDTCPIYLVTLEEDESRKQAMKESIAEECSDLYGMNIKPGDITDCDGCRAGNERIFPGCLKCEIRKCAGQKRIDSCAYCDDYPCEILSNNFSLDQDAKKRLEQIRNHS